MMKSKLNNITITKLISHATQLNKSQISPLVERVQEYMTDRPMEYNGNQ